MKKLSLPFQMLALLAVFLLVQNRQSISARLIGDIAYDAATAGPVELYTTSWCGYCRQSRAFLQDKGIAYREYDIEASDASRTRFASLGGRGVPLLAVGGATVSGYRPHAYRDALENASRPR